MRVVHRLARLRRRLVDRRDFRELVAVDYAGGQRVIVTCEEFKRAIAEPEMAEIDALPKAWRKLVNEFGPDAFALHDQGKDVPATTGGWTLGKQKKIKPAEAARMLGPPIQRRSTAR